MRIKSRVESSTCSIICKENKLGRFAATFGRELDDREESRRELNVALHALHAQTVAT